MLFAGALRSYVRDAAEGLGTLILAGAVIMAVGAVTVSGVEYGLAHHIAELRPGTAQTLNVLSNELGLPILAGAFVFALAAAWRSCAERRCRSGSAGWRSCWRSPC